MQLRQAVVGDTWIPVMFMVITNIPGYNQKFLEKRRDRCAGHVEWGNSSFYPAVFTN